MTKSLLIALVATFVANAVCNPIPVTDELVRPFNGTIWALLVAGSNGYYNYRHQADVCHSYHVLRNHGIPAANIITMMYDDIANHEVNSAESNWNQDTLIAAGKSRQRQLD